jgi:hypothetical protein
MAFNLFCNPVGKLLAHFQAYLSTSVSSLLSKSKEEIFAEKPSFAIDAQNYDTVLMMASSAAALDVGKLAATYRTHNFCCSGRHTEVCVRIAMILSAQAPLIRRKSGATTTVVRWKPTLAHVLHKFPP